MRKNTKLILIGVAMGILSVIAAAILTAYYVIFMPSDIELPEIFNSTSIIVGEGLLDKGIFVKDDGIDRVSDIASLTLGEDPGEVTAVAGRRGVVFVDASHKKKAPVYFSSRNDDIEIIDVENDGVPEFMNRGSWTIAPSVISFDGTTRWTYDDAGTGVDNMAAGDMDGDGDLEFGVGFNGGGGVHMLESDGSPVWKEDDGNVWHVEFVDAYGDGKLDIVHSNAAGCITLRDIKGKIISKASPTRYFSDFSLINWPDDNGRTYMLDSKSDTIRVLDYDGKSLASFDAPYCGDYGKAKGAYASLVPGQQKYFAVVVSMHNDKGIFYLYNPAGELVYQEVLGDSCDAIGVIKDKATGLDIILVGGTGKVWQYAMK